MYSPLHNPNAPALAPRRALLLFCFFSFFGCSSSSVREHERRQGAKINIPHFITHTANYKGKAISLELNVDGPIDLSKGQSLCDYVGRDAKFTTFGPKGERLNLVITIPAGLAVPQVGNSDDVRVWLFCKRGELKQGNEAKSIEIR